MDCTYLNRDGEKRYCHAQPMREREDVTWYVPTEEDKKKFCESDFTICPRLCEFRGYMKDVHK